MGYHLTGGLSTFFFILSLYGLWSQYTLINRRSKSGTDASAVVSLNQLLSSYIAFFAFVFYGAALEDFNHYLFWSRLLACLLLLVVLGEVWRDRRDRGTAIGFFSSAGALLLLLILVAFELLPHIHGKTLAQLFAIGAALILLQGYYHQARLMKQTKSSGGVSLKMHLLLLFKDLSTAAFGCFMTIADGWPLLLTGVLGVVCKGMVLQQFYLLRPTGTSSPESQVHL